MICETYKTAPVSGGLENWPAKKLDAFKEIRRTHLLIEKEKMQAAKERQRNKR